MFANHVKKMHISKLVMHDLEFVRKKTGFRKCPETVCNTIKISWHNVAEEFL